MSTITNEGTMDLVLHDREPDCDGISYEWRRVTVPKWLGTLVLKTQEEATTQKRFLDEANAEMLRQFREEPNEAFDKDRVESIVENIKRLDIAWRRAAHRADALHDALIEYLIDSEQGDASCSHILSHEEEEEFLAGLVEEDDRREEDGRKRFELRYWCDEGYHSVFYAR